MMRLFFLTAIGAGGLYILTLGGLYLFQEQLVFFPKQKIKRTPGSLGLEYTDLHLRTEDNVTIHGWYVPADSARATVLYFHGNANNIGVRVEFIRMLHDMGLNVCAIDYRGYGRSEGKPTEEGTYLDAKASWRYLISERHLAPEKIILLGRSLGGAVAVWLATQVEPGGLILGSTFTSLPEISQEKYPVFPAARLVKMEYNTLSKIRQISCPVLITHSRDDNIVPFSHGRRLYEAANPPKEFLEMRGGHNENLWLSMAEYREKLNEFVTQYLE